MLQSNTTKNISQLNVWFFPLIIVAKTVRWTIMFNKLVAMSIGNRMAGVIAAGSYSFRMSMISEASSGANIAESNCGALFSAINFFGITSTAGWEIYITFLFNIFTYLAIVDYYKKTPNAGKWENIFIYLGIAILNIFCFNLSKEPYQMLFFFLMAWGIKSGKDYNQKTILLSCALVATVLFARKYYALVLFYFFIINYIMRYLFENIDFTKKEGIKKLIYSSIFTAVLMGVAYLFVVSYFKAENEEAYQGMVVANYRTTIKSASLAADSEILPLFSSSSPLLMAFDYTIKIFRLLFPIELLLKGKFTYIFLLFFQGLLVYFIGHAFIKNKLLDGNNEEEEEETDEDEKEEDEEEEEKEEDDEETEKEADEEDEDEEEDEEENKKIVERQTSRRCALYLYIAFLLCSAAFEPDFGSWIRHQGVALPVLLLLI